MGNMRSCIEWETEDSQLFFVPSMGNFTHALMLIHWEIEDSQLLQVAAMGNMRLVQWETEDS